MVDSKRFKMFFGLCKSQKTVSKRLNGLKQCFKYLQHHQNARFGVVQNRKKS